MNMQENRKEIHRYIFGKKKLVYFRQNILKCYNLIRSISDFHIITRVLSADNPISLLEVGFYFDTILVGATWANSDNLVERWAFLVC